MKVQSAQPKPDFEIYMEMMEGIKGRIEVVKGLMSRKIDMRYALPQVESIALQIRMIVESIALASLSANKSIFEREGDKFKEFWKAKLIFRDIKNINPDFFPKPLEEFPSDTPGEENITNTRYIEEGFMTDDEMIEVYDQVCKFLHVKNPYSDEKASVLDIGSKVANWINRIIKLLNSHQIKLLNDDKFYLVHMYEPDRSGYAAMYEFHPFR